MNTATFDQDDELKDLAEEGMGSGVLQTRPKVTNFQVRRPDILQFATVEGLTRMAGVGEDLLRRLIVKEVADNALDEMDSARAESRSFDGGSVTVRRDGDDTYIVEDEGRGISQDADVLCDLFSALRPMVSGKFLRKPSRGTLGNGLRVLAGAVALSDGTITVESHGGRTTLRPRRRIGDTEALSQVSAPRKLGTQITFTLGAIIPRDDDDLIEAETAISLATAAGPPYMRPPSPHWLDFDCLVDSLAVIEPDNTTVRQVIERLDGCSGATAGRIAAPFGKGRACRNMREPEVAALLRDMQERAREVKPHSLGPIGGDAFGEEFDGYIVAEAWLNDIGAHEPHARIPVLIEAWASVTSRRDGDASLNVYRNRTPVVGNTGASRGDGGVWIYGAGLSGALMEVKGGDCELIVAVTAPFIPTTSSGKAPDLSRLQPNIVDALRRAFVRSRNLLPPDPAQPKPPKSEPPPKKPKPKTYQPTGPLAIMLAKEAERAGVKPSALLVLENDPFDEKPEDRRNAEWFVEQVKRHLPESHRVVHLRGMYYRCLAAGNTRLPNGTRFVGIEKNAKFIEKAGKYARHLNLLSFERIIDERAAKPELYIEGSEHDVITGEPIHRKLTVSTGWLLSPLKLPELDELLPTLSTSAPPTPRQRYRIVMIGEKVSLGEVLRPIAEAVHGELLLATGEVSEAAVYGIAKRAADDGRPLIILYFCDFDPAGGQMPISVARKIQAHIYREFPKLNVRVIHVALTVEQVIEFKLPDSPIKSTESRGDMWREHWKKHKQVEVEQVEIDALAALRPEVLRQIALEAVAPYFDFTYERRYAEAIKMPQEHLDWFLGHPAYRKAKAFIRKAYRLTVRAIAVLNTAKAAAVDAMRHVVEDEGLHLPDVVVEPETRDDEPDTIFDSSDDYVTATRRLRKLKLKKLKALSAEDDDD